MFEILNTKNIVAVTATANVIKKASKCNVRWQSFGSPPDHCLTRFGGPTGFLVDSGHPNFEPCGLCKGTDRAAPERHAEGDRGLDRVSRHNGPNSL